MELLDFTQKLRSKRGKSDSHPMFIDSESNQTEEETMNEGDVAHFFKPELNMGRKIIQEGLGLLLANIIGKKR